MNENVCVCARNIYIGIVRGNKTNIQYKQSFSLCSFCYLIIIYYQEPAKATNCSYRFLCIKKNCCICGRAYFSVFVWHTCVHSLYIVHEWLCIWQLCMCFKLNMFITRIWLQWYKYISRKLYHGWIIYSNSLHLLALIFSVCLFYFNLFACRCFFPLFLGHSPSFCGVFYSIFFFLHIWILPLLSSFYFLRFMPHRFGWLLYDIPLLSIAPSSMASPRIHPCSLCFEKCSNNKRQPHSDSCHQHHIRWAISNAKPEMYTCTCVAFLYVWEEWIQWNMY